MLKPMNGMVEVELIEQDLVTSGGIVLPSPEKTNSRAGKVLAIDDSFEADVLGPDPGSLVVFDKSAIREVIIEGGRHFYIHEKQIIAVSTPDKAPVQ